MKAVFLFKEDINDKRRVFGGNTEKVIDIPLERIETNPTQPRRFFDLEALAELAASIDEYGVIQPITVKKKANGSFLIIAGERRYRASCMAKKRTIPAIVVNLSDSESAAIALLENLQRKDLTFFEEAEGYARLMNEYNMTQDELSEKLGKSQSSIANKLRLLKLDDESKTAIFEAGLTERHARALLKLANKKSREKALKLIIEKKLNVAKAENLIDRLAEDEAESKRLNAFKAVMSEDAKKQKIFCNTVNKAIRLLDKSGIKTEIEQAEDEENYIYTISIKKS